MLIAAKDINYSGFVTNLMLGWGISCTRTLHGAFLIPDYLGINEQIT